MDLQERTMGSTFRFFTASPRFRLITLARFAVMAAILVVSAAAVMSHGDKKHVVGTIEKVNADSVVVKTADGKSVEVKLVASTMYVTREGKTAKFGDLAVGERVVIHATPAGDTLSADEVKFSPPGAPVNSKP
jgi:hypothetical protein